MAKRLPEGFEIIDADLTSQLTEEQRNWKVVDLRPTHQRFEMLEQQTTTSVRIHLRDNLIDIDQVALAADILTVIQAMNTADRELGGGGLILSDRRAESASILLVLRHATPAGASDRAARLASMLAGLKPVSSPKTSGGALELLRTALSSSTDQMQLLMAGSRSVSRCEVLAAV